MTSLLCAVCGMTKAVFLFSPSQAKLGKPHCMACISLENKRTRQKNGKGSKVYRETMHAIFPKTARLSK